MMLETLLNKAGPDTTMILVSDHGFHSGEGRRDTDGYKDPVSWHRPFGVVCVNGPGIKQDEKLYGATLLDVTPTILAMFGLPVGGDMDGRPWLEILDTPVRAERVISWDQMPGECGLHPEDRREDPTESAEAIRHLVELGYIEAPSEDAQETVRKTILGQKTNLAKALSDSNRLEKAVPMWEELIAQDEQGRDYYSLQLAYCLMRLNRLGESEKLYLEILGRVPNSPMLLVRLGQLMSQGNRMNEAMSYLQRAEAVAPDMAALQPTLGQVYLRLKRYDDAERAFRKTLEHDEESPVAYNGLARVAISRKQYDEAIDLALRAVGLTHNFPRAHYNLGVALAESGMRLEAIQAFETCVGIAPGIKPAHRWLARLYRAEGIDPDKARRHELMGRPNN
jgi:tetratricopeptide (TPR) repeat protein